MYFVYMPEECSKCIAINKNGSRCKNSTCRQYPYCWIHLKSQKGTQVKDSTIPDAGKGLFATQKFKPNELITYYSAKNVLENPQPQDLLEKRYVLQVGQNKYLDSEPKQNFVGRYINSIKNTGKRSNVRFSRQPRVRQYKDRNVVPIFTTKHVKAGDEFLLNYGLDYRIPRM